MISDLFEQFGDLRFADLRLAWVLVPALVLWTGIVVWTWVLGRQPGRDRGLLYSDLRAVEGLGGDLRIWLRRGAQALRWLTLVLLILAVLRPQTGRRLTQVQSEGIDIVLVLDVSTSMLAEDLEPNRLEAAKLVAADFVSGRTNDRIGLVAFAGQVMAQGRGVRAPAACQGTEAGLR